MKKRKDVATQQQIEWLKKRASQLEDNTRQLKNKLHTESYFWKHDKKELVTKMLEFYERFKKSFLFNQIFAVVQFITNLLVSFWLGFLLIRLLIKYTGI